jgi:DNA-binding NarL/FixJ family response regulator
MTDQSRIVIADDHPIFRSGLRLEIETDPAFLVIGEADDGVSALRLIEEKSPDIVVLDVNMPELSGFDVLAQIRGRGLSAKVIMMTMHKDEAMFSKALALGACGYVLKDSAAGDILQCLHAVVSGENYTSAAITTYLFKKASGAKSVVGLSSLTPAERNILRLIAEYKTSREIADELCLSVRTIENHRSNICSKLDVRGTHALVKFALLNQPEI